MKKLETTAQFNKRKNSAILINSQLKELFPNARIILNYNNDWELLVSVMLSAQCTDKMVNKVTDRLFKKYRALDDYVKVDPAAFEQDIKKTGFFRNKTKNILSCAKIVKNKYKGKVPDTMVVLLKLPGIARKSANVILGIAFGIVEGIAVDTHVKRLSKKFGLTDEDDPVKIEKDLMAILPKTEWLDFTLRMIEYGRHYSPARKRGTEDDPISKALSKTGS